MLKYLYFLLVLVILSGCHTTTSVTLESDDYNNYCRDISGYYPLLYIKDANTLYFENFGTVNLSDIEVPEISDEWLAYRQADICGYGYDWMIQDMAEDARRYLATLMFSGEAYKIYYDICSKEAEIYIEGDSFFAADKRRICRCKQI